MANPIDFSCLYSEGEITEFVHLWILMPDRFYAGLPGHKKCRRCGLDESMNFADIQADYYEDIAFDSAY